MISLLVNNKKKNERVTTFIYKQTLLFIRMLDNLFNNRKVKFGLCVSGVALLWNLLSTPTPSYAEQPKQQKQERKLEELTMQDIERYMSLSDVQSILEPYVRSGKIIDLQITPYNVKETLRELHDETFEAEEDGVLWFGYGNKESAFRGYDCEMREGIIYIKLNDQYYPLDKIKFISLGLNYRDKKQGEELEATLNEVFYSWGLKSFDDKHPEEILKNTPSIFLFCRYDVLKGETPEFNNDKIKHVDTLFRGPKTNNQIFNDFKVFNNWIKQCVFGKTFKKDHVYLFRNTYKVKPYKMEK